MLDITIAIVTFNNEKTIEKCLDGILSFTKYKFIGILEMPKGG